MLNDQIPYGLGYSKSGYYLTQLIAGAVYDSYQINSITVQVYDNDGAFTTYKMNGPIIVFPDMSNIFTITNDLISGNPRSSTNIILNQGSYLSSLEVIQGISSLLNDQSLSDKLGLMSNKSTIFFPRIYGPLSAYSGVTPVSSFDFKKYNFYFVF